MTTSAVATPTPAAGSSVPAEQSHRPWTLRGRLGRTFAAIALLLALLIALLVTFAIRFALAGNGVIYHWQPALSASQRLVGDLVNQETGVRGYILSGKAVSLRPYTDFRAGQKVDTATVLRLVGDDSAVRRQIGQFTAAAVIWQRDVAEPVIADVTNGLRPGTSSLDTGRTKFDRVREAGATLQAILVKRALDARDSRKLAGVFVAVALGVGLLVLLGAGILVWRGLSRWVLGPVDRLGSQARRVTSGELTRQITGAGPAELRDLGADVEYMRAQIVMQLARAEQVTDELRRQGEELERSNADLQQFAYVASHDLSEPLRKVANFCQLLERQYAPQLDDRARQYIGFAVDGAKRMQDLITDLLALSRVGRDTDEFAPLVLDDALDDALSTLAERMRSTGARLERPRVLPIVSGDRNLLASLLENLVGNAVKYRRDDVPPVVRISVDPEPSNGMWTFTLSDNGIGIQPQYAERIFAVFQRLHLRDQFGGTGIGLALCRRIVDFHGGRIWLDTVQSGQGATFRFTLAEGGDRHAGPPRT